MDEPKALALHDLIARTNQKKPKAEDVKALRVYLAEHPGEWRRAGDLVVQNTMLLLQKAGVTPAAEESIQAGISETRLDLGYEQASEAERLLIDHVLLCKLHLDIITYKYTLQVHGGQGYTIAEGEYWERRLTATQMRYLRALESLARVRKMALPVILNLATNGGQQVNVAGDLIKQG